MKFRKFKFSMLFIISMFLFSISSYAVQYIIMDDGYYQGYVEIKSRTSYNLAFENGVYAWNSTPTKVWIKIVADSDNYIIDNVYNTTWGGQYNVLSREYIFWGRATKFNIKLNRKYLVNENDTVRKSFVVHEFGHVFCLADNPCNTDPYKDKSIMNYGRDRTKINVPQSYDINGVNSVFK